MNTKNLQLFLLLAFLSNAHAQGVFFYSNGSAFTRIGSMGGPLAGTNIYAQMFAGAQPDSLTPIGPSDFHINGIVSAGNVSVLGVAPYNFAYVQLLAWDSSRWGTDWLSVPQEQFGRTDIVSVYLTTGVFPDTTFLPQFNQPAIVPVPEPAAWALFALAGGVVLGSRFVRRVRNPE